MSSCKCCAVGRVQFATLRVEGRGINSLDSAYYLSLRPLKSWVVEKFATCPNVLANYLTLLGNSRFLACENGSAIRLGQTNMRAMARPGAVMD